MLTCSGGGSWRRSETAFQRLIVKSKIDALRRYLSKEQRVFVNNIIVTLHEDTRLLGTDGNTVATSAITTTQRATVSIPNSFNSIGIIDGQHRLFSYHEGGPDDAVVMPLRRQQNLLVTGIIFPASATLPQRERFQAKLFLEINSTQTNARSDLKQSIVQLLNPFSDESIARTLLDRLNKKGPLKALFQEHSIQGGRLKTTTVVSYGLKPLVRLDHGPLFRLWSHVEKDSMRDSSKDAVLAEYLTCTRSRQ